MSSKTSRNQKGSVGDLLDALSEILNSGDLSDEEKLDIRAKLEFQLHGAGSSMLTLESKAAALKACFKELQSMLGGGSPQTMIEAYEYIISFAGAPARAKVVLVRMLAAVENGATISFPA